MSNVRILISQKRGAFLGVLVAHHTGSVGVRGSNPLSSTNEILSELKRFGFGAFCSTKKKHRLIKLVLLFFM